MTLSAHLGLAFTVFGVVLSPTRESGLAATESCGRLKSANDIFNANWSAVGCLTSMGLGKKGLVMQVGSLICRGCRPCISTSTLKACYSTLLVTFEHFKSSTNRVAAELLLLLA